MFNIVFLDADSLGMLDLSPIAEQGALMVYASSGALDLTERIKNCECVVASHVPIRAINMERARSLKLIVTIDSNIPNIDLEYAKQNGIKVVEFFVTNDAQKQWVEEKMLRELETKLRELVSCTKVNVLVSVTPMEETEKVPYMPEEKAKDLMEKNPDVRAFVADMGLDTK